MSCDYSRQIIARSAPFVTWIHHQIEKFVDSPDVLSTKAACDYQCHHSSEITRKALKENLKILDLEVCLFVQRVLQLLSSIDQQNVCSFGCVQRLYTKLIHQDHGTFTLSVKICFSLGCIYCPWQLNLPFTSRNTYHTYDFCTRKTKSYRL